MSAYWHWLRLVGTVIRSSPWAAALMGALLLLTGLQPIGEFWALRHLVDALLTRDTHWLPWLLLLTLLLLAVELGQRTMALLRERLQQDGEIALTERLLQRAGAMPLAQLESADHFDRLERARSGIKERLPMALGLTEEVIQSWLSVASLVGALALVHPGATLLLVAASVPSWLVHVRMANEFVAVLRSQTEGRRRLHYLMELLLQRRYAAEIRSLGLAPTIMVRWEETAEPMLTARLRTTARRGVAQFLSFAVGNLAFVGAVALLGAGALWGSLSPGGFAAAVRAAQNVQRRSFFALHTLGLLHQEAQFATDTLLFLEGEGRGLGPTEPRERPASPPAPFRVRFDQVSYSYPGTDRPALSQFTFKVQPGELVALVGENGAGKSTLIKLLLGLYQPTSGRVLVDGIDVGGPEGAPVRAQIATVFQDYLRYALTLGENISLGDVRALGNQHRITAAAAAAEAAALIDSLPLGLDTPLGPEFAGGQELSGGQWQRVATARGYMRRASLIILDEPTAALDPKAEMDVLQQFRAMAQGRTAFFSSHRLGAARLADRILVLKAGRLVEAGTHAQLITQGGEYAALFAAQAEWYQ